MPTVAIRRVSDGNILDGLIMRPDARMMAQSASLLLTTWCAILGQKVYIENIAIGSHTGADQVAIYFSIASQGSNEKNRRLLGL